MPERQSERPTIASDEDMDWGYVLVDRHAPDYETARRVLRERAVEDWGMTLGTIEDHAPNRRSYYWTDERGEDELMPCESDDPRRDSDWWVFDLSMNDHDFVPALVHREGGEGMSEPSHGTPYHEVPWRTGRKVYRTIYATQRDRQARDSDPLIGVMDTPEAAAEAVHAHNATERDRLVEAAAERYRDERDCLQEAIDAVRHRLARSEWIVSAEIERILATVLEGGGRP